MIWCVLATLVTPNGARALSLPFTVYAAAASFALPRLFEGCFSDATLELLAGFEASEEEDELGACPSGMPLEREPFDGLEGFDEEEDRL